MLTVTCAFHMQFAAMTNPIARVCPVILLLVEVVEKYSNPVYDSGQSSRRPKAAIPPGP